MQFIIDIDDAIATEAVNSICKKYGCPIFVPPDFNKNIEFVQTLFESVVTSAVIDTRKDIAALTAVAAVESGIDKVVIIKGKTKGKPILI